MSRGQNDVIGKGDIKTGESAILLPRLPEFWDHGCEPSHPTEKEPGIIFSICRRHFGVRGEVWLRFGEGTLATDP